MWHKGGPRSVESLPAYQGSGLALQELHDILRLLQREIRQRRVLASCLMLVSGVGS